MTLTAKGKAKETTSTEETLFEDLFREHWNRICRVLYRLVGDWDEAEDLALDTFVRLYRQPPARNDNPGGWLYRVATNLGFNALRARKRRQQYEQQAGLDGLERGEPPSQDPAAAVEHNQQQARVRQALAQIKPRSAQLLILRHSGLSYAELAAAVDVKPSSIGTLLSRAEVEFADCYRDLEQGPEGESHELE